MILILSAVLTVGCSQDAASPPPIAPGDTTGNGGGGDDNSTSPWILQGPVTYQSGELTAANPSAVGDTTIAIATTRQPTDFGDVQLVTFSWRQSGTGGAQSQFFIGEDTVRMDRLPVTDRGDGLKEAQIQLFLGFSSPIYARFVISLPPESSIRIAEYRAGGR